MYRLKKIDQQVVAFEQLIIKAHDDGARKERARAFGAAITTISSMYPKLLTHLDAEKVLDIIKEDLRQDTAHKLEEELLHPSNNLTAAQAGHSYYGVHTKRERREIGQDNQFLAAQAAHASMVASHSRYSKRSRELFDDSREFVGGVHYAIGATFELGTWAEMVRR
jgi:hypothetical protein